MEDSADLPSSDAKCAECKQPIQRGDPVIKRDDGLWVHQECAEEGSYEDESPTHSYEVGSGVRYTVDSKGFQYRVSREEERAPGLLDHVFDLADIYLEGRGGGDREVETFRYGDRDTATRAAREQRVQRQLAHKGLKFQKVRGENLYEIVKLDGTRSNDLRGTEPLTLEELEDDFDLY
jgi:hypothetical protein